MMPVYFSTMLASSGAFDGTIVVTPRSLMVPGNILPITLN